MCKDGEGRVFFFVNKKEAKKTLIFLLCDGRCQIRPKGSKSFFGSFFSKKELLTCFTESGVE
jgi:hypothetical protein